MKTKLIILLILIAFITPLHGWDGDDMTGGKLPKFGTVCKDSIVYSEPSTNGWELGAVKIGDIVRLRDNSYPDGTWVMIEPAKWIPIEAVCW